MKKIFVIVFSVIGTSLAFGQNNAQEASQMTNKLVTNLSLSADQAQRVADIYNNIALKNEAVLNDANATEQFKKDAVAGNTSAGKDLVKNVLTAEQNAKWVEMEKKQVAPVRKEQRLIKQIKTN